ncbi:hypothetical protein [Acinetobacter sp. YH12052]|uniref:hypothetical protein n=1 Tax=Acinetobacter sp. YH12052 TaxID=2601055 RepID=UPI0015D2386A|nr:hypothetical protein [Acinetobacter sp. YH12052]
MDIQNFIAEFKKTFVYDILSQTLSDEQLFERVVDGDAVLWFKEQTRQMWLMWEKAKAQAVPEGFVLVSKDNLSVFWQDSDEPENFCSSESDFDDLGDCIELGDIMEINKHTQAHIQTEKLSGTWFAEAIDPSEKANFFVGTHEECIAIVEKNKAMIEAQEPAK